MRAVISGGIFCFGQFPRGLYQARKSFDPLLKTSLSLSFSVSCLFYCCVWLVYVCAKQGSSFWGPPLSLSLSLSTIRLDYRVNNLSECQIGPNHLCISLKQKNNYTIAKRKFVLQFCVSDKTWSDDFCWCIVQVILPFMNASLEFRNREVQVRKKGVLPTYLCILKLSFIFIYFEKVLVYLVNEFIYLCASLIIVAMQWSITTNKDQCFADPLNSVRFGSACGLAWIRSIIIPTLHCPLFYKRIFS